MALVTFVPALWSCHYYIVVMGMMVMYGGAVNCLSGIGIGMMVDHDFFLGAGGVSVVLDGMG